MPDFYIKPKQLEEVPLDEEMNEEKELEEKKKDEYSAWGIFFGVMLTAMLIAIWERAFLDLPRFFNPLFETCQKASATVIQKYCHMVQYETIRLMLHICLVVPLLVIMVIATFVSSRRKLRSQSRIIVWSYFFSVFVVAMHLFIEFATFLFRYYRMIGNYVVLASIALAFIVLIVYLQQRYNSHKEKK